MEGEGSCAASCFASVEAAKRRSVFAEVRGRRDLIPAEPFRTEGAATDYYRVLFSIRDVDGDHGEVLTR